MSGPSQIGASTVVRTAFGTATVGFAAVGFLMDGDARWFAASGAFGTIWLVWDLLMEHVLGPFGEWVVRVLAQGGVGDDVPGLRPTLDDTIRLLENHLARPTHRKVDLNAAIRLEEIYRTVKKDPDRAREVIRIVQQRYPEAPELKRFEGQEPQ